MFVTVSLFLSELDEYKVQRSKLAPPDHKLATQLTVDMGALLDNGPLGTYTF